MTDVLPPLHLWQENGIEKYLNHDRQDFLAEITPAAGKTRFAAEIASRLVDGDLVERVIVVVPTTPLRKQSSNAFRYWTGLDLNYQWISGSFPATEFDGIVVTYQSVMTKQFDYRKFCADRSTLVVLDEPHHTAIDQNEKSWGTVLRTAFEPAKRRLLLSGTPFRTDEAAIPFVRYGDGGIAHGDISYSYGEALQDGIVRWVGFPTLDGKMEWIDADGKQSATFDDDLDEEKQSRRLRTALSVQDGFDLMPRLLANAHRELSDMRQDDPVAAGIVFAIHQDHARQIQRYMQDKMQCNPVLAISDELESDKDIETFREGNGLWIITVRKVSEGIDIPRLRVGVYATNVITEMFFRQSVGRVIRNSGDALFFIPPDPRLIQFSLDIRKQRDAAFTVKQDDNKTGAGGGSAGVFIPLASTAGISGAIADQFRLSQNEMERAERVKLIDSNTARLPTLTVAVLLRNAGHIYQPPVQPTPNVSEDKTAIIQKLKQKNSKVVRAIALKYGIEYKSVNNALNQLCRIRSIKECFVITTLEQRLSLAEQWYSSGEIPTHA
jgi:superfamily II DNA or RNA helicase